MPGFNKLPPPSGGGWVETKRIGALAQYSAKAGMNFNLAIHAPKSVAIDEKLPTQTNLRSRLESVLDRGCKISLVQHETEISKSPICSHLWYDVVFQNCVLRTTIMKGLAALFITLFAFTVVNSQVPKAGYDPIALFPRVEQIQEFVKGTDATDDAAREYAVLNYLYMMTQQLYLHGPLMKDAPEFFKQIAGPYGNEFMKNRKTLSDESKAKYRNDLILLDDVMRHFFRTDLREHLYKINHMTAPPRPELSPNKNGRLKN